MLTLTRSKGQAIMIGPDIVIRVVEIGDGKVKIGVEAPKAVAVDRPEVRARKEADRVEAERRAGMGEEERTVERP
jgi:carbon storage regulator